MCTALLCSPHYRPIAPMPGSSPHCLCSNGSGLPGGWDDLTAVAVATGPGLAPCLKVGLEEAKRVCREHGLTFLSVNHLEAHALVPRLLVSDAAFWPSLTPQPPLVHRLCRATTSSSPSWCCWSPEGTACSC